MSHNGAEKQGVDLESNVRAAKNKSVFQIDLPSRDPWNQIKEEPMGTLGQVMTKNGDLSLR